MPSSNSGGIGQNFSAYAEKKAEHVKSWKQFQELVHQYLPFKNGELTETISPADFNNLMTVVLEEKRVPRELMLILNLVQDLKKPKGFDYTRQFIEVAPEEFRALPIVSERYLVALNKTGAPNLAIEVANNLHASGHENGETWAQMGKAYRLKYETAEQYLNQLSAQPSDSQKTNSAKLAYEQLFTEEERTSNIDLLTTQIQQTKVKCRESYTKGFEHSYDHYPGINAAFEALKAGDYEDAKILAQLTYKSCHADGGRKAKDFWCSVTMVQAACLLGTPEEELKELLHATVRKDAPAWQIQTTISAIREVKTGFEKLGLDPSAIEQTITALELVKQGNIQQAETVIFDETIDDTINKYTFTFRKPSYFVGGHILGGNYNYGGSLNDHTITRTDLEMLRSLFDVPLSEMIPANKLNGQNDFSTLGEINDPKEFLKVTDQFIRHHFGNEEQSLEIIDSSGHKKFDKTVEAQSALNGMTERNGVDSRTNISVALAFGLGDCRLHAYTKQALFDIWQRQKMTSCMQKAYRAGKNKDFASYEQAIKDFDAIEKIELVTFDAVIQAPIEIRAKYRPVRNERDELVMSDSLNVVEDHTMNLLLTRDADGRIEKVELADSFYHQEYGFASGEVPLDSISVTSTQSPNSSKNILGIEFPAGTLKVAGGEVAVTLRNTNYGGDRTIIAKDEYGDLRHYGHHIDLTPENLREMLQKRAGVRKYLEGIREWHNSRDYNNDNDLVADRAVG